MLPERSFPVLYMVLADDAFPLMPNLGKIYPGLTEKILKKGLITVGNGEPTDLYKTCLIFYPDMFRLLENPLLRASHIRMSHLQHLYIS